MNDRLKIAPDSVVRTALAVLAACAAVLLLRYAREVFVPVVLGVLFSAALEPAVRGLARLRVPRALGAALVVLSLIAGLAAAAWTLQDEAAAIVDELPKAAQKLRASIRAARRGPDTPIDKVQQAATELEKAAQEATAPPGAPRGRLVVADPPVSVREYLVWGSMEAAGLAAKVVMMVFLVYFLLLSGDLFKRKLVSLAGPRLSQMKTTVEILDEIEGQVQRYLLVEALTAVIVGAATWAALAALGLEQAVLWGILAGVLNTIPYFGPVIVTAAIVVVGFLQFGALPRALAVGGAALAVTSLEGWLLRPALFGRATRMNHVAIFVGLIFWGWVWGVVGVLLAVPLMTVIKAVCDRVDVLQPVGELIGD